MLLCFVLALLILGVCISSMPVTGELSSPAPIPFSSLDDTTLFFLSQGLGSLLSFGACPLLPHGGGMDDV